MSTAKNSLIALLALTTLGGAALAWHQYQELSAVRTASLSANERAELQKKIWDLQKANRELTDKLAAASSSRPGQGDDVMASTDGPPEGEDRPRDRGPRGRGQQMVAMRELMQKPEVQAILASAEKAVIDSRYAALFRSLNLSPEQTQKLTSLLAERQNAVQDVMSAARDQGLNPRTDRDAIQKLVADAQNNINDSIKSVIGDSGFSQLTNYEQTIPQRNIVNVLQQRLANSDSPLNSAQADQLVQILAAGAPAGANNGNTGFGRGAGGDFGGGFGGRMGALVTGGGGSGAGAVVGPGAAPITAQAVSQASAVLAPTQLNALEQLQKQQQNAQQLQQMIRNTWQQTNGGGGAQPSPAGAGNGGAANGGRARGGR